MPNTLEVDMDIYTAHYRYSGNDRLDITVKGNTPHGRVLAPTWAMVNGYKAQKLSQWDYTVQYFSLLVARMNAPEMEGRANRSAFNMITENEQITLVCFCPAHQFCHRILAARMLENMGYGRYVGEWSLC
jgi:hypothetical protein